ncbi:N-acetylmuramoyl-L-alanine amidase [Cohnella soli]|uniref:N-acetylmuramoyl-L-alanine amidase n=1 Tax=Cohnella soli TaxID=425005 RepID=A0ABW0HRZ1_9BACL
MRKWIVLLFVATGMLLLSAGIASAAKADTKVVPQLVLDGIALQPPMPPILIDNRTLIPARVAIESLGYKVDYNNEKRQVTVSGGSQKLIMTIDNKTAYFNDKPIVMDVAPMLMKQNTNTYTFIPLNLLKISFGLEVTWDNDIKAAFIYTDGGTGGKPGNGNSGNGNTGNNGNGNNGNGNTGNNGNSGTDDPGTTPDPKPTDPAEGTEGGEVVKPPVIIGNLHSIAYEPDIITVSYDGFVAPTVSTLDNPKRLVFDLPSVQYASDFTPTVDFIGGFPGKIDVPDHLALTSVRFSLFGDKVKAPRIVLDLKQTWGYEIVNDPSAGLMRILLKQPTPDKSKFTVVLDAGHGGSDPGASSLSKRPEKEFNLSVILKVQAILVADQRLNIVMTRSGDTYPSLADRYNLANSIKADLFVSVHGNSYTAATNGTETYYTREESRAFADLMHSVFAPATGLKNNGVRQKSLAVTRETKMPAILLEVGYLSSKIDEPQMWNDEFQNRVAAAIAQGIKMQLKLI